MSQPNASSGTSFSKTPTALADRWILSRLAHLTERVSTGIDTFEFGEVSRNLYEFFWSEFCDWYIELAKGRLNGTPEERAEVQGTLLFVLDNALRLLHPMMPYITEEIWRKLPIDRSEDADSLIVAAWPEPEQFADFRDPDAERRIELLKAVVTALRTTRARYGLSPKTALAVTVKASEAADATLLREQSAQIATLATASSLDVSTTATKPPHSAVTVAAGLEIYIPLEGLVDFEAEAVRLSKERDKTASELARLDKKLSNEGFLAKAAPAIIEKDRAHAAELSDALSTIEAQLGELG